MNDEPKESTNEGSSSDGCQESEGEVDGDKRLLGHSLRGFRNPEKVGDCDDLAPWLAAERIIGKGGPRDRKARAVAVSSPGIGWHVVVRRGDGRIEVLKGFAGG